MQGAPTPSQVIQMNQHPGMVQSEPIGIFPSTSATTALVLSIIGLVGALFYGLGLFFSIPSVVIGNKAQQITNQIPGHPDAGVAKAAIVIGWVGLAIGGLFALFAIAMIIYFIIAF
tara:strand:- start:209 stop:556 length:348 start_codon:yes stop_codon:yes gene_type:complete